jgi:hypothetical protein
MLRATEDSLIQTGGAIATWDSLIQARDAIANLGFPHPDRGCDRQPGDSICSQGCFATLVGTAIVKLFGSIVAAN